MLCATGLIDQSLQHDAMDKRDHVYSVVCAPLGRYLRILGVKTLDLFSLDVEGAELRVLRTMDWSIPIGVLMIEVAHLNAAELDEVLLILNKQEFTRYFPSPKHASVGEYNWIFLGRTFNSSSIDHDSCNFSSSNSKFSVWQQTELFPDEGGGEEGEDGMGSGRTRVQKIICGNEDEGDEKDIALQEQGRQWSKCFADLRDIVHDYLKARQAEMARALDGGDVQKKGRLALIFEDDSRKCLMDTAAVLSSSQVLS